jgi:ubiquinone/menaquinone biosynthesis C-methylase UbiE
MGTSTMTNKTDKLLSFYPGLKFLDMQSVPSTWNINGLWINDQSTEIVGWSLPFGGQLNNREFLVNGHKCQHKQLPYDSVYSELYPWCPNAGFSGFSISILHESLDLRQAGELNISIRSTDSTEQRYHNLDLLVSDLDFLMPDKEIAARIGATVPFNYTLLGRTLYRAFERVLIKNFKTDFGDYQSIVDWGCGSGRIARHVVSELSESNLFRGFDIDEQAIEWSNANIGPYFSVCETDPPLLLPDVSVDLLYAYSVLTHLARESLTKWLDEVSRIMKPGGVVMATILSDSAIVSIFPNPELADLEYYATNGVLDNQVNNQLDTLSITTDYRNVWLKRRYVESLIESSFELVDCIPSFHFYQDLLVLRKL